METYFLNFRGVNGYPSRCQIRIYRQAQVVIATDIDEGMSVTNASAIIANEVIRQFAINPQRMFFIEEYRHNGPNHTTDLVQFDFADGKAVKHPRWSHISEAEFERIVQLAQEVENMV
ncbi:hypothetical protein [uncultured Fibrella sp.]|uniref:hypothetical protein n=1 Tax=uncultured Fibrella sp. TaxID=1284596 RepID=UPI0035C9B3C5